jgi:ribosomal protein S18 acetylase RimI-like enzyme
MNVNMIIRKFRDSDKDDVLSLWKDCGLLHQGTDYAHNIDTKMSFQPWLFFVATIDEMIMGSIVVGYDGWRGWLNCLAVHPDLRHKGYGKALVDYGIERLVELGCPKVNLQVRETNMEVIEFYKKLGFKEDRVISLGKRLV